MNGTDDVIATLSSRVSELSKRVALLQAELDAAQKRVAVYEEHDATIQDALSGALRAAYTIRERAEVTAEQILEQAREERRVLLKEIDRLREERDTLQDQIASHRRSGIAAVAPRPLSTDAAAAELRSVASEALRGLFQEIVDDMRTAPRSARAEPPSREPAAPPVRPEAQTTTVDATPAPARPALPAPPAAPIAVTRPMEVEQPTYEYMAKVRRPALSEEEEIAPAAAAPEPPRAAEAVTEAPSEPAAAVEPQPAPPAPPLEVVPRAGEADEIARPRVEATVATSDIQLVLSPVPSFPRLVEIERHIQALPAVRTLYVRDFRGGSATLAVALRSSMTPEEFAELLEGLDRPRMRLVSGSRNTLELRIEGEAGVA